MQSLRDAIKVLLKEERNAIPDAYWVKGNSYVFRIVTPKGEIGCNYYVVEDRKVTPTNPMRSKLDIKDMKKL